MIFRGLSWVFTFLIVFPPTYCVGAKGSEGKGGKQSEQSKTESPYHYAGAPVRTTYRNELLTLTNTGYVIGYDEIRKNPAWTAYRLFQVDDPPTYKPPKRFSIDMRTAARISHDDYANTDYDRGRNAPSYGISTRYGQVAQKETFLMSNITPQMPHINRQIWKDLEHLVVESYANEYKEVWVITGPIYDDDIQILEAGIEIPDSLYKIVLDVHERKVRALAWIICQCASGSEPLTDFLVSIDEVEEKTGLDFHSWLNGSVERSVEKLVPKAMW